MKLFYCIIIGLLCAVPAKGNTLEVVASIKPVHSLVASVMQGSGSKPRLLVSGQQSPHGFALKPSHRQAIAQADVLIYIDEHFETFLAPALQTAPESSIRLALIDNPRLSLLPLRRGGAWPEHHHDDHEENGAHEEHEHHEAHEIAPMDGHIWLSPANAAAMTQHIAETLAKKDPAHAVLYHNNAAELRARLQRLDAELKQTLAPYHRAAYLVYHDAYHYAEHRYGLHGIGAIADEPEHPLPAKRLLDLRHDMEARGVVCVFREPQFPNHMVERLVGDTGVRIGLLDPEGGNLTPGPDLYEALMRQLAQQWTQCLRE